MYLGKIEARDGSATITLNNGHNQFAPFKLVGTSMPTSALTDDWIRTISVYPKKGKNGVIAICQPESGESAFISVNWDGDKILVNNGKGTYPEPFLNPNRIGQIYEPELLGDKAWIEVQINNRRYTSNPRRCNNTTHLVTDTNLLCRYIVEDAEPSQVIHAAIETKQERSLRGKLDLAEDFGKQWKAKSDMLELENHKITEKLRVALTEANTWKETWEKTQTLAADWHAYALRLTNCLKRRWWLSAEEKSELNKSHFMAFPSAGKIVYPRAYL